MTRDLIKSIKFRRDYLKIPPIVGLKSYTDSKLVGRTFKVSEDSELFNFDIQHYVRLRNPIYIKITGCASDRDYFCHEFHVFGSGRDLGYRELKWRYTINFQYVENSTEVFNVVF